MRFPHRWPQKKLSLEQGSYLPKSSMGPVLRDLCNCPCPRPLSTREIYYLLYLSIPLSAWSHGLRRRRSCRGILAHHLWKIGAVAAQSWNDRVWVVETFRFRILAAHLFVLVIGTLDG